VNCSLSSCHSILFLELLILTNSAFEVLQKVLTDLHLILEFSVVYSECHLRRLSAFFPSSPVSRLNATPANTVRKATYIIVHSHVDALLFSLSYVYQAECKQPADVRFFCPSATRERSALRHWIDYEKQPRRHRIATPSHASSARTQNFSYQLIFDSTRETDPRLFAATDETAFYSGMVCFTGRAPGRSRLFCQDGIWPWTRTRVIAAIASDKECVTPLLEGSADGSKYLHLLCRLLLTSGACFTVNYEALHKSSTERNSVLLRVCVRCVCGEDRPEEARDIRERRRARCNGERHRMEPCLHVKDT